MMLTTMLRRIVRPLAVAVVAVLVATACGGGDQAAGAERSVTIYSGRTENLIGPILDDFAEATGISVRVRYGQSADLALLIDEEAAAGSPQADVFLSQSPGSVGFLENAGRLAVLPDDTLERVPESVRDSAGQWVGFSGRQRVLVYNSDTVDPGELPDSVFGIVGDEWAGRVGVAPPNGSFQDFVTAMRVTEGDDTTRQWLEDLAANDPVTYPNNNAIVAAVGRGEIDVGLVNHYYNYRFLDEDPSHPGKNHVFAAGDPGAILIVTAAAIIDGTENPDDAAALINFLLGSAGQRYFADETFEYPLANGEEPSGVIPPLDFDAIGSVSDIDYERLGGGLAATRDMIADAGLDG